MKTIDILVEKILFPWLFAAPFVAGGGLFLHHLDNHTSVSHWVLAPLLVVVILGGMVIGNGLSKRILR